MNCPTCNVVLLISERQGIEIDYCQKCRGVWLDRGELDKLIERTGSSYPAPENRPYTNDEEDYERKAHPSQYGAQGMGHKKGRENPIGELFDFF